MTNYSPQHLLKTTIPQLLSAVPLGHRGNSAYPRSGDALDKDLQESGRGQDKQKSLIDSSVIPAPL